VSDHFVHPTAVIEDDASIGAGTQVWNGSHIRANSRIGQRCVIGFSVFIDSEVVVGDRCKIQNHVSIYRGVTIGDDVFVGPGVMFTNDRLPRLLVEDWQLSRTEVGTGASIGANATVVCGVEIGSGALVGAGAVVTKSVGPHELVLGNPARRVGWICSCGERSSAPPSEPCGDCGSRNWIVR
jgi:UDP-2-acetamido-3-amino-2,3-dideoxy-glucuronate N-acetyltransferase